MFSLLVDDSKETRVNLVIYNEIANDDDSIYLAFSNVQRRILTDDDERGIEKIVLGG